MRLSSRRKRSAATAPKGKDKVAPSPNKAPKKKGKKQAKSARKTGNVAGAKHLDPKHNTNIAQTQLQTFAYDILVPSIEVTFGRCIRIPGAFFKLKGALAKVTFKMQVIGHDPDHTFGTKTNEKYGPGFEIADVSNYSKGVLAEVYKPGKRSPWENQWITSTAYHKLRHEHFVLKPKEAMLCRQQRDVYVQQLDHLKNTTKLNPVIRRRQATAAACTVTVPQAFESVHHAKKEEKKLAKATDGSPKKPQAMDSVRSHDTTNHHHNYYTTTITTTTPPPPPLLLIHNGLQGSWHSL
jgi:hypothetical protein